MGEPPKAWAQLRKFLALVFDQSNSHFSAQAKLDSSFIFAFASSRVHLYLQLLRCTNARKPSRLPDNRLLDNASLDLGPPNTLPYHLVPSQWHKWQS